MVNGIIQSPAHPHDSDSEDDWFQPRKETDTENDSILREAVNLGKRVVRETDGPDQLEDDDHHHEFQHRAGAIGPAEFSK
jgi:hypothetical protein